MADEQRSTHGEDGPRRDGVEPGGFPKLCAAARHLPSDPAVALADADIVRIACSDCPFYKEGEDEELECGAFRLLRHLLRRRVLTVGAILDAVRPDDGR